MNPFPNFHDHGKIDREFDEPFVQAGGEDAKNKPPLAFGIAAGAMLTVLVLNLFYHQAVKSGSSFLLAEQNRIRVEIIPAPRGVIFDRNGNPLTQNIASYHLTISSQNLPSDARELDSIITAISQETNIPVQEIKQKLSERRKAGSEIVIKENISQDEALKYQATFDGLPGVDIEKLPLRKYPFGEKLAHVLGYVGKPDREFLKKYPYYNPGSYVGKSNVELAYEQLLKGKDGQKRIEVDARGQVQRILAYVAPKQGGNVVLSLDAELQKVLHEALPERGAAVAFVPQTGEVLALVSKPSYDSNVFLRADKTVIDAVFSDKSEPLVNRAISGVYPSGSTIKPLWAAAALTEKTIDENFAVDTPPEITIGEFKFPDWKDHGLTNVKTAIAQSNNIFFYGLAGGWGPIKGLGINKMVDYMKQFGFGEKTGIDLTAEQKGFVPTPAWKKKTKGLGWYLGDTYHLGIGQGDILVTPLQLLVAESAIYNGGKLIIPHVGLKITDDEGQEVQKIEPQFKKDNLFNEKVRRIIREGMRLTVTSGSAQASNDIKDKNGKPVEAAAKTGTAQFGVEDKTHAWFIAFAPWENPQIGIVVLVEGGGEGHAAAQPVAKKALEWWFGK